MLYYQNKVLYSFRKWIAVPSQGIFSKLDTLYIGAKIHIKSFYKASNIQIKDS